MRPKIPSNLQTEDPELKRRRELEEARAKEDRLQSLQDLATDQTKQRIRLFGGFTAGTGASSSAAPTLRLPDFTRQFGSLARFR